jgi:preprotein translocase subunit SecY
MSNSTAPQTKAIGTWLLQFFSMQNPSWIFIIVYFIFVLIFSFFYVSITFNTEQVSESIQKRWGYIPWIRPWTETAEYLARVSSHLNLFWGWFLAFIAVLPYILEKVVSSSQKVDFLISWAWLIILVSTILDLIRKVDSEMKMFDYSKYK